MTKYEKDGVSVLNQSPVSHKGFTLNLTRAYMDNDRVKRRDWEAHGLKAEAKLVLEDLTAEVKSGIASVSEYISVYGEHDVLFNASVLYIIFFFKYHGFPFVDIAISISCSINIGNIF